MLSKAKVGDKLGTLNGTLAVSRVTQKCVYALLDGSHTNKEYRFNKETGVGARGMMAELVEPVVEVANENTINSLTMTEFIAECDELHRRMGDEAFDAATAKSGAQAMFYGDSQPGEPVDARPYTFLGVKSGELLDNEMHEIEEKTEYDFLQKLYELDVHFEEKECAGLIMANGDISKNGVRARIVQYKTGLCEIYSIDQTWQTFASGNMDAVLNLFNLVAKDVSK